LHKYWDGTVNEWRSTFRKFSGIIWEDITLDELYEYWRLEIEPTRDKQSHFKTKEDENK